MNKLASGLVILLLTGVAVTAQNPTRVYTEPAAPSQEVLDRLNLKLAWRVYLPTERRRDGIFSIQIPERLQPPAQLVLVQTRSGVVMALDTATGATLWRTRVGTPYFMLQRLGYNSKQVFVVNGVYLYALSRETGEIQWEFALPHVPSAAPVADEDYVYITLGTGRLHVYQLPRLGEGIPSAAPVEGMDRQPETLPVPAPSYRTSISALGVRGQSTGAVSAVSSVGQTVRSIGPLSSATEARMGIATGLQPRLAWDYMAESRLELPPLVTAEYLLLASYGGTFTAMAKLDGRMQYHFQAGAALSAPLGQHNDTAYVGSEDFSVYALDIFAGRILWRYPGGGPIRQKPQVNDDSIYIAPERAGLYRLDRAAGQTVWRNSNAKRFLAANTKFVYATDRSGRLLILDRNRGTQLAVSDVTRDFVVPIANELTDRVFLASNDGLMICLHDREYSTPLRMKTVSELTSTAVQGEPKKAPVDRGDKGEMRRPEKPKDTGAIKKLDKPKDKGEDKMPDK